MLCITNNSIKYQSFVYTQLNVKTILFPPIQFCITSQFKCQTVLFDLSIRPYQLLPLLARVGLRAIAMKWYSAFPKLQHYWSLTISLFSVINRTLVRGVLPLCREAVGVFFSPSRLGHPTLSLHLSHRKRSRAESRNPWYIYRGLKNTPHPLPSHLGDTSNDDLHKTGHGVQDQAYFIEEYWTLSSFCRLLAFFYNPLPFAYNARNWSLWRNFELLLIQFISLTFLCVAMPKKSCVQFP